MTPPTMTQQRAATRPTAPYGPLPMVRRVCTDCERPNVDTPLAAARCCLCAFCGALLPRRGSEHL